MRDSLERGGDKKERMRQQGTWKVFRAEWDGANRWQQGKASLKYLAASLRNGWLPFSQGVDLDSRPLW